MIDLKEKIKNIILRERKSHNFTQLDLNSSVELIQLILENYEICNNLKQDFSNLPKEGELILLMAPTGAGKDALAIELNVLSPNKNYIELNMDIFRHYFP